MTFRASLLAATLFAVPALAANTSNPEVNTLTLDTAPGPSDSSSLVPTTAWVRQAVAAILSALPAAPCPVKAGAGVAVASDCTVSVVGTVAATVTNGPVSAPTIPTSDTLPTIAGAVPGGGLTLAAGAVENFAVHMSSTDSTANIKTTQDVFNAFYTSFLVGNQTDTTEIVNATGHAANDQKFYARARHYAVNDTQSKHVVRPEGLALLANCTVDCGDGNIFSGMIRLPFSFHPNTVTKVRFKAPKGLFAWTPIWFITGEQLRPTTGSNPYSGGGVIRTGSNGNTIEIDWNDLFAALAVAARGKELDFGVPDIYGTAWTVAPHVVFAANSNGFAYHGTNPLSALTDIDCTAEFCTYIANWQGDYFELYIASDSHPVARLAVRQYVEFNEHPNTYTDANDNSQTVGMSLIIGNQAVPNFQTGASSVTDNEGVADGWTMTVSDIASWTGSLTPDSVAAATVSDNALFTFEPGTTAATIGGANFTWFNRGASTVDTTNGVVTLSQPAHNGENYAGLVAPIGGNGTVTSVRIRNTAPNANYYNAGLIFASQHSAVNTILMNLPSLQLFQGIVNPDPVSSATSILYQQNNSTNAVYNTDYCYNIYHLNDVYNIFYSSTCAAGSYTALVSPSAASLSNPTHIGVYANSNATDGGVGTVQLRGYSVVNGSNTQVAGP